MGGGGDSPLPGGGVREGAHVFCYLQGFNIVWPAWPPYMALSVSGLFRRPNVLDPRIFRSPVRLDDPWFPKFYLACCYTEFFKMSVLIDALQRNTN
jgi:hypothetical protein